MLVNKDLKSFKRGQSPAKAMDIGMGSSAMARARATEERYKEILWNKINWVTKPVDLAEVHDEGITEIDEDMMEYMKLGNILSIPEDEFKLDFDLIRKVPGKYRKGLWMVHGQWEIGEKDDEEDDMDGYLMDCSGYSYPRYLSLVI